MKKILFVLAFLLPVMVFPFQKRDRIEAIYTSQIGIREATGHNDGKQVEMYLSSCNTRKGASWCAAFVNWCLQQAGIKTINNPWAPAWFPTARTIYSRTIDRETPRKGDVFCIYNSKLDRIGHVGFIHQWGDKTVITVEGNTNEAGSREGDGVYKKVRLRKQIYKVSKWVE